MFAAFLVLLGLTTATAASFDVRAEDIASFTTDVSISVPDPSVPSGPWYLFRAPPAPGGIAQEPEGGGPHKWKVDPTGSTSLIAQTDPGKYYVWSTGSLGSPLSFQDQHVEFSAYLTAGGDAVEAALLSCPADAPVASSTCGVLATAAGTAPLLDFGRLTGDVPGGNELRLKVVNTGTQFWQIEWGYKTNRDSNLLISEPGA